LDFSIQPIKAFFTRESNHALHTCKYAFVTMSTYGERLEEALRLVGKDRQQLADALGISVQAVSQVILGKTKALTAENSARAARFIGINPFWLATGEGAPGASQSAGWPFRVPLEDYDRLSDEQKQGLEAVVSAFIKASIGQSDDWGMPKPSGVIPPVSAQPTSKRKAG